jgi:hypothetical protein
LILPIVADCGGSQFWKLQIVGLKSSRKKCSGGKAQQAENSSPPFGPIKSQPGRTEREKGLEAVINPRSGTIERHSLALLRIHDEHRQKESNVVRCSRCSPTSPFHFLSRPAGSVDSTRRNINASDQLQKM